MPLPRRALRILLGGALAALLVAAAVGSRLRLRRPAAPPPPTHVTGSVFRDVTAVSGLSFRLHGDAPGGGVALGDLDGDGSLDAVFAQRPGSAREPPPGDCARLFRNRGDGTFEDVTKASGVRACGRGTSVLLADLDGDGDLDLVIGNAGEEPTVWRNDGRGRFTRVEGTGLPKGTTVGIAPLDANGDGVVDLYVGRDGAENVLLGGKGDLTFLDVTAPTGTGNRGARTLAVAALDFDGDGWTDLWVSNEGPATLFRSETFGRFRAVPAASLPRTGGGSGLVIDDLDGDGRPDVFLTRPPDGSAALFRNVDGVRFEDAGRAAFGGDAPPSSPAWGAAAIDDDDDGRDDLALSAGRLLFRNRSTRGAPSFAPVPGVSLDLAGRGLAAGDLDGDLRVDLVVSAPDAEAIVLRNEAKGGRAIEILPVAGPDGKTILGTRVTVSGRAKEFRAAPSYMGGSWVPLHFGLGERGEALVSVRWPDGSTWDSGTPVKAGFYRLRKGSPALVGRARELRPPPHNP